MSVRIAPLQRADLRRCAELERILFAGEDPWSESAFASELDWGHYYLGAYADELLVGYAGLSVAGPPGDTEASVHTIGVDPVWHRKGIGRELLRALLARADEVAAQVFLEVRTDNAGAIALYQAHGFTTVGLRRRYYQPSGADAYTMARPARVEETT
ncbi:ribosomal protein S18-alanine N-acetyltransferase [Actinokineospora sp. NBRC 105648]|uniref:ribosomal protein S18-alanine N-acetyltransferase n=1 Tax=Actinokineospora sp. NBRC 105648 TaxID=3032206 RepID=UPI0024A18AE9|nr:ribosomal protein S18-alanine N-acetyltransferase [Actinokineospora sp. NBRC 105648]GLZ42080.1 ribosomal-protein-alanine acetyltransferase [Actinokineospora sp. NBRC 105648]